MALLLYLSILLSSVYVFFGWFLVFLSRTKHFCTGYSYYFYFLSVALFGSDLWRVLTNSDVTSVEKNLLLLGLTSFYLGLTIGDKLVPTKVSS